MLSTLFLCPSLLFESPLPMTQPNSTGTTTRKTWQEDLLASLVVFLVALPLCMGIAIASNAPVAAGLITGIVGGLIVGSLAGSPLQVSGPAAGLTVVCGEVIRQNGMEVFGLAVLLAGIMQLVAGLLRLGQWFRAVSPAVIHGMLSGIGVIIFSGQLHVLVDDQPRANALANIAAIPESLAKGLTWPSVEPLDVRRSRIELLQTAASLTTRQNLQHSIVKRAITRAGSDASSDASATLLSAVQPFLAEQKQLLQDAQNLATLVEASALAAATDGESLKSLSTSLVTAASNAASAFDSANASQIESTQTAALAACRALTGTLKRHEWAGKIGLLAVGTIVAWQFLARGRMKLVPAPLLAIVLATFIADWFQVPVLHVDVPNRLLDGVTWFSLTTLTSTPLKMIVLPAIVLAVVASAETLLCATAVDQMHTGPRTKYDRELQAQGFGNLLCGIAGVLPMTGVIVRSAANVQAGARSRLSAILHGLWLLLFSVALTPVLRMIPTTALAGILVYTGFRLMDFKGLVHLWKENRFEGFTFLATVVMIVSTDLLSGVIAGLLLSAAHLLWKFSHLEILESPGGADGAGRSMTLLGAATFVRLPVLATALEKIPVGCQLTLDISDIDYIDRACMDLIQNWTKQHVATGGQVTINWDDLHARFQTIRPRTSKSSGA